MFFEPASLQEVSQHNTLIEAEEQFQAMMILVTSW